ncbi:LamG-like jellyroll fold domain-containing protein [Kitasatospora sp. MAP12-44]|uniref:LamG-like jellyroll fold domain-containing protein n=3 Tax=Kitasatospora TaxID=2063 RepID=UPI00247496E9|nr:LamG-like jellyroll fold domain-containing protein [Kitasatospora sp. MAP12-44]
MAAGVLAATVLGAAPAAFAATPGSPAGAPTRHTAPAVPAPPSAPTPEQPTNLSAMESGQGPTVAEKAAMVAAAAQAHTSGKPVVVDALTTESQQVVAQPKGGFALTGSPKPVRTKESGVWKPVDTTLRKGADGMLSPVATAYGSVRFSGGGRAPLAVTSSGGASYSVSWPTALPTPTVSGGTATYAEVLPGVDLTVSATVSGGFSDVLVVKNAQAAKNPALAGLKLAAQVAGGKLAAAKAQDGVAVTGGADGAVLESATPMMWDSNTTLPAAAAPQAKSAARAGALTQSQAVTAKVAPDASDAAHPGAAARIAVVATKADAHSLTLIPDAKFLTNAAAAFPEFIDPTFNWHPASANSPAFDEVKQGSPCNGSSLFNNTGSAGDGGQLGVGVNGWSTCQGIMRTFYQWSLPTVIWGADISSATVNATKVYSASCSENPTVSLHWAGGIGSGTDWNNQPGYGGDISSAQFGPSYNANFCPGNGSVTHGLDVTSPIAQSASGHWGQFTAALTEDSYESSRNDLGFSRFSDNPSLQIFYNLHPNTPGASDLSAVTGADNAGCATSTPYPYIGKTIASNTPVLNAHISDPDGDALQANFKYWVDGSSTSASGLSGDNLANGSTAAYSLPSSFISSLSNGKTVDWQTQVTDGEAWSGWSPVCHFTAEPTGPDNPTVQPNPTYPNTDKGGKTGAPAGTNATFVINGSTTGAAAAKFIYGLDQQPATSNTPANQTIAATNNAASVSVTPQSAGPHTLWVAAVDSANDLSGMNAYRFMAAGHANTTCASLAACFNNTAISADANMSGGAADGFSSFSATDLANAGWTSGGKVTVNGAPFTLPAFGSGQLDNVLAANQTITVNAAAPASSGSALMFLATSTNANLAAPGAVNNEAAPYVPAGTGVSGTYCFDSTNPSAYCPASGVIKYTDNSTQPYSLVAPDWITGPVSLAAMSLPHENRPSGQVAASPKIYPFSIPLTRGKTVASVTLPDVGNQAGIQGLHIFGLSTRNTTTGTAEANGATAAAPNGQSWTGAWGSPTVADYTIVAGQSNGNQTFRTEITPSMSGNTVRIKLDNAMGMYPLVIGHATVAAANTFVSAAVPGGATTDLKFGGSQGVTVPEGGMVYSDPLPFNVQAQQFLLVSFDVTNTMSYMPMNPASNTSYGFISAPGSGDHAADTADTAFSVAGATAGSAYTDFLTDVDVTTTGVPTQAVLGDGLVDPGQPNTTQVTATAAVHLAADLAQASPSTTNPYGTVDEGIQANQIMTDTPAGTVNASALSRIDRDILDQPGLNAVVLQQGLEDILHGQSSDNLTGNGYTQLLTYLQASGVNVIAVGLTPCDGYAGDGATGANDPCTSSIDKYRTTINTWLNSYPLGLAPWSTPALNYIDPDQLLGTPDTTNIGEVKLTPNAAFDTDNANLNSSGYGAIASGVLGAQDTWPLNDGNSSPTGTDTASNTGNAYLAANPAVGQNPVTLNGGASWVADPTQGTGTVLNLDGTSGYAASSGPVVNTSGSFTVSAWVNLSSTPTSNATIVAQNGSQAASFAIQYDVTQGAYCFDFTSSDTANATVVGTPACFATNNGLVPGDWTNVVVSYNATTKTAELYDDGMGIFASEFGVTPWSANGTLTIGSGQVNGVQTGFFPGKVSDVQVWNYALSDNQVGALDPQVTPIH